ncbi:transcriptional regulator with XRE-family HTH domain [Pedobacter sp. AK013]|uniref:helix-turn-helix domain-containing protein n=1 Tax=Pedobacter sp. AK013 TaxID=2723071 RepID=UPI0016086CE5|nr:helix-turn-helix transcriptional regulator [Pedobacter sp. AK013]MBB6239944.1 transcriptional regulator with XRE-family HTH domain [Pedobacter sp. AK013]
MKIVYQSTYQLIGNNIKRLRKEQGLSQEELANRCERIDRSKISDIENAKEDFMLSTLLEVCAALDQELSVVCSLPSPKATHE